MCHLILLLPIFGLAVFWVWPVSLAVPVYTGILLFSGLFYFAIIRAMKRSVQTGKEGLLHKKAEVLELLNPEGHVRVHGEIWQALSSDSMHKGDYAEVVDVEGLKLQVRKWQDGQQGQSHSQRIKANSDKEVLLCQ